MNKLNLLEFLENSAEEYPQKIAFTDENNEITYSMLRDKAKALATLIIQETNIKNSPIAVLIDRDIESIVAMQAILYSGNFYVPIDDKSPVLRAKSIAEKAGFLLYTDKNKDLAMEISSKNLMFNLDSLSDYDNKLIKTAREGILDIDPAYMIFTSGSTGEPKGIVVSHQSVIDFTHWLTSFCQYKTNEVFANQAPFYFDMSVKDIYQTLSLSATCHIMPKKYFTFPLMLLKSMEENKVTAVNWATSAFNLVSAVLDKCKPTSLKKVYIGGEVLHSKYVKIWQENLLDVEIYNSYGPTEISTNCTAYKINRDFEIGEAIPIGKACANMEILLFDDNMKPVKQGETGEICVRGQGLAKGYYGDKAKTEKAFAQNPLNDKYTDIIYKTGDLAFENPYGEYVFVARVDNQIKHMGYRIELSEIEVAINAVLGIKECVCIYKNDKIIAIYSGDIEKNPLVVELRKQLPKYMIPNIYVKLESLPYNANGKIDRVKLKEEY